MKWKNTHENTVISHLKKGLDALTVTFYRFPLTLILLACLAALFIYRLEIPYDRQAYNTLLDRLMGVISLGIPLSLCAHLSKERYFKNGGMGIHSILSLGVVAFLSIYFHFLLPNTDTVHIIRLLLVALAASLIFLSIPYMWKREGFDIYIARLMTRAATSWFFSIVLGAGLSATLFAVRTLLLPNLSSNLFAYIWILTWSLFAPIHFLTALPHVEKQLTLQSYNTVIKVLLLYIVLPIISLYTVVLYLYFMRILLTWEWPSGMVSYLVVSYSAVSIAALFLIHPFRKENKWAGNFTRYLTWLIFPLLAMMFISIGIRIRQYGITENRYFIMVIGLWSLFAILHIIIQKGRYNAVLAGTLALVTLLSVLGPVNGFVVSRWSQNRRFESILIRNNMLENGTIVGRRDGINQTDREEITAVLSYFSRSHQLASVRYLPENFDMGLFEDTFGFSPEHAVPLREQEYFNFWRSREHPLVITDYDLLIRIQAYQNREDAGNVFREEISGPDEDIIITFDGAFTLTVERRGAGDKAAEVLTSYALMPRARSLHDQYGSGARNQEAMADDMLWAVEEAGLRMLFNLHSMNGYWDTDGIRIQGIDLELFIGFAD